MRLTSRITLILLLALPLLSVATSCRMIQPSSALLAEDDFSEPRPVASSDEDLRFSPEIIDAYAYELLHSFNSRLGQTGVLRALRQSNPEARAIINRFEDLVIHYYENTTPTLVSIRHFLLVSGLRINPADAGIAMMYYDLYGGFDPSKSQEARTQLRLATARVRYLNNAERIDYYKENVRFKSAHEMAQELGISQSRVYFETWFFNEEITRAWSQNIDQMRVNAINARWTDANVTASDSFAEAATKVKRQPDYDPQRLAEILGVSVESLNLHLAYLRQKSKGPRWSKYEIEKLEALAPYLFNPELAKDLGRSESAIRSKKAELGLSDPNPRDLTPVNIQGFEGIVTDGKLNQDLFEKYMDENFGLAPAQIAATLGLAETTIRIHLQRLNYLASRIESRPYQPRPVATDGFDKYRSQEVIVEAAIQHYIETYHQAKAAHQAKEAEAGEVIPAYLAGKIPSRQNVKNIEGLPEPEKSYALSKIFKAHLYSDENSVFPRTLDFYLMKAESIAQKLAQERIDPRMKEALEAFNLFQVPPTATATMKNKELFFESLKQEREKEARKIIKDLIAPELLLGRNFSTVRWAAILRTHHDTFIGSDERSRFSSLIEILEYVEQWRQEEIIKETQSPSARLAALHEMNPFFFSMKIRGENAATLREELSKYFDDAGFREKAKRQVGIKILREFVAEGTAWGQRNIQNHPNFSQHWFTPRKDAPHTHLFAGYTEGKNYAITLAPELIHEIEAVGIKTPEEAAALQRLKDFAATGKYTPREGATPKGVALELDCVIKACECMQAKVL